MESPLALLAAVAIGMYAILTAEPLTDQYIFRMRTGSDHHIGRSIFFERILHRRASVSKISACIKMVKNQRLVNGFCISFKRNGFLMHYAKLQTAAVAAPQRTQRNMMYFVAIRFPEPKESSMPRSSDGMSEM